MTLDTRMGLNVPDEGLIGSSVSRGRRQKPGGDEALKVILERRKNYLNIDRMTWYPNWRDLSDHFLPARGRWMVNDAWDTNKGWRRNFSIVDSTPLIANNTLRAGLSSGCCSEARPWFAYGLEDADSHLLQAEGVKDWLNATTQIVRATLGRTNFYNAASECFGEYGVFGILALGREWPAPRDDEDDIPHFQPFTIGSYYIGNDRHRRVCVWYRDFRWTVEQIVQKFALRTKTGELDDSSWVNISRYVKGLWDQGNKDAWVNLTHAVYENEDYRPGALGTRGMRFSSVYYERGGEPDRILSGNKQQNKKTENDLDFEGKSLRVKGFRSFPVFVARWYTNSEDAWGRGPAMDALGDARALQLQQRRKAQAIDKHVDPPMVAHPSLRNSRTSMLSGDVTFVAPESGSVGFQPAYTIKPEIEPALQDIAETQGRINAVMHADIFALFIQAERSSPGKEPETAAEINAKQQEKLLMLGPVLGQLNFELFNPLHDWLFAEHLRHGKFPPIPKALAKVKIRVKYTSLLAQAMAAVNAQGLKQLTEYVLQIGELENMQGNPVLDKFDADEAIEHMADFLGTPPTVVRSDEAVAQLRNARAQAQEKQQQMQMAEQAANAVQAHSAAAKNLAQAPIGQGTMLDALAGAAGANPVGNQ